MKSIMEMFYYESFGNRHPDSSGQDSELIETARVKSEILNTLVDSMTDKQKEWFEEYTQASDTIDEKINFKNFCHAFHLGSQLMAEMIQGKGALLK